MDSSDMITNHWGTVERKHPTIQPHRLPSVPFKPNPDIEDAWDTWCYCGWGATCDSLEVAVIGAAHHLEDSMVEPEWLHDNLSESKGTADMIQRAKKAGVPVYLVTMA